MSFRADFLLALPRVTAATFEAAALALFRHQAVHCPPYAAYLAQLNPARYQEECQRVAARFDEAVELAEQAFLDELAHLVTHLTERLSGTIEGTPKIFRDSAIGNLHEFFERFRALNPTGSRSL